MVVKLSLGETLIPKEQAFQFGVKVLTYWSRRNRLAITILDKKWFEKDSSGAIFLTPAEDRKEILKQLNLLEASGGNTQLRIQWLESGEISGGRR